MLFVGLSFMQPIFPSLMFFLSLYFFVYLCVFGLSLYFVFAVSFLMFIIFYVGLVSVFLSIIIQVLIFLFYFNTAFI